MKLLIVNDLILTVETMKVNIEWVEYGVDEVVTAYDVSSAKNCIQEKPVDIILCDIEMPEENGMSLLRWIRDNDLDIKCIFLTCHANFDYAKEAIQLGCQDYILSPAKYEEIGRVVLKVVNRIREQREATRYQEYGKLLIKEKINQAVGKYGQKSPKDLVDISEAYIIKNLGSFLLSVKGVAEHFFIHPVYLNRIFKKNKGISISQYIIGERMKLATDYLKSKKLSANIVAGLVGYQSYANFNFMFKKYYNCTPSQYQFQDK